MQPLDRTLELLAVTASLLALAVYEWRLRRLARRAPARVARVAHARLRERWVMALAAERGSEILAVQTLRNSLMSSTIVATTAALALMGVVSLGVPRLAPALGHWEQVPTRGVLLMLLMLALFSSFVTAALASRLFNHAGYMLAAPVGSALREEVLPLAAVYLRRAGQHYGWSLRLLFLVAPLVAGLLAPLLMPLGMAALLTALTIFDRPPRAGALAGRPAHVPAGEAVDLPAGEALRKPARDTG